jgi:putative transposase
MAKLQVKASNHCVYNLNYHLVLVTKYRRRVINQPMLARLHEICAATAMKWESELMEFNGEPDHVHLLLSLNPKVPPAVFVNNLKTVTSRLIRKDFARDVNRVYWKRVFWSRTYCILSCGGAPLSVIKQYISNQAGVE